MYKYKHICNYLSICVLFIYLCFSCLDLISRDNKDVKLLIISS